MYVSSLVVLFGLLILLIYGSIQYVRGAETLGEVTLAFVGIVVLGVFAGGLDRGR